jgi:hypothetical protein
LRLNNIWVIRVTTVIVIGSIAVADGKGPELSVGGRAIVTRGIDSPETDRPGFQPGQAHDISIAQGAMRFIRQSWPK